MKANAKYVEDSQPIDESNYLMYRDANNLYGWASSERWPFSCLEFDNHTTVYQVLQTRDTSPQNYLTKVDLVVPEHLHDKYKQKNVATMSRIMNP